MHPKEIEKREWAARQIPRLTTYAEAMEIFNNPEFKGFRKYLIDNGVREYLLDFSVLAKSRFYDSVQVEKLASEYRRKYPRYRITTVAANFQPPIKSHIAKKFLSLGSGSWTDEQFLACWGNQNIASVKDLLNRANSVHMLSAGYAYCLCRTLLNDGTTPFFMTGPRYARNVFIKEIKTVTKNRIEAKNLIGITQSLYASTDIGKLPPSYVVAVLYQLMKSA